MSPAAAIEAAYAAHLTSALSIPVFPGLSGGELPQEQSFVVTSCDECLHVGGGFYRGVVAITLRTHALDETSQAHSGYWGQISQALETPPANVCGQFRTEQANDREDHYWLTRETIAAGFASN